MMVKDCTTLRNLENDELPDGPAIWIIGEARSGTTLLADILSRLVCPSPPYFHEHINVRTSSGVNDHHLQLRRTKVIYYHWRAQYAPENIHDIVRLNPDVKFIHMHRRDKVAQAVSLYIALKLDTWQVHANTRDAFLRRTINIDDEMLLKVYDDVVGERAWQRELRLIDAERLFSLSYEEFIHETPLLTRCVLDYLGVHRTDEQIARAIDAVELVPATRPETDVIAARLRTLLDARRYRA